ncbi:type II toxin-antitoxin system death-on-curing family toxin [Spiroplasma endosymbiont of Stenodema calcarata]|uniref:type II toxin-antitoxin system death-on-curing family toxin n=1 Tax=Spiroplasma endosymbiont of Stenodema calcarata TaxID=3139328 RepID=UPI003CCB4BD6
MKHQEDENKIKQLPLFLVMRYRDDFILEKAALENMFIKIYGFTKDKLLIELKENSIPKILVKTVTKTNNIETFEFSLLCPVGKDPNNPWADQKDWIDLIKVHMHKSLDFAKTIRDSHEKYYIDKLDMFDMCAAAPFMDVFGQELHKTVLEKAAILMYNIVKTQPFFDGNKRTGLLTTMRFLQSCGYDLLRISSKNLVYKAENFMISVANSDAKEKEKTLKLIKNFILSNITINIDYQKMSLDSFMKYRQKYVKNK